MSLTGKLITLDYFQPGVWFGDMAIFAGEVCLYDVIAHGPTTILSVTRADFDRILEQHPELAQALLRLQARRLRLLSAQVEDLALLPLRARLAKQIARLARHYGAPAAAAGEVRITLHLAQEEMAQMLGASRQRVNQELKIMEREGVLRIEPVGLVVRDPAALLQIGNVVET
jgi:CRP-like cAMP-binding protein